MKTLKYRNLAVAIATVRNIRRRYPNLKLTAPIGRWIEAEIRRTERELERDRHSDPYWPEKHPVRRIEFYASTRTKNVR